MLTRLGAEPFCSMTRGEAGAPWHDQCVRAMALEHPGPIESRPLIAGDLDDPSPAPDELLLRVAACAVCRTDLQICEGEVRAQQLPVVPGHQVVGHVAALGRDVTQWRIGDRAGIGWLGSADETCDQCRAG